ncbi:MAG: endonuclease domain-containing protein [Alphaproteobacteria bacterium]|nr:endonuclease domain-containing protein [Alphaproteobacteria bacterium]
MKSDNKSLHVLAQNLRNNSTLAESVLWKYLRNKQAQGFRFRRQTVFGKYIVDFYCPRLKLVIEIDGSSHNDKYEYDRERDEYLQSLGLTVLHLDNSDILHHIGQGLFAIDTFMQYQKNILKK